MKLSIRRNYEVEAMFLKTKNGDRWEKMQRNAQWIPGIEGLERHQPSFYVGSRIGLTWYIKSKHKMKLWTNVKFLLFKTRSDGELSCAICTEINDSNLMPDIQPITQVVSSVTVICFYEIHPTSALRTNDCCSHSSRMLAKEVSCETHTQLQQ
jgi:hypothetical protein